MEQGAVTQTLARLRAAADQVRTGFPWTRWERIEGPGPETLELDGNGGFRWIKLEPGKDLLLRCALNLPEEAAGVRLAGDPLEATLFSLYPTDLKWNGQSVFAEEGVPVAAGPALFTVLPRLQAGDNGTLELRVRVPNNQTTTWLNLRLMTPGLRARFERLDVAWAQLALAAELAATPQEEEAVLEAAALVPPELIAIEGGALETALAKVAEALSPLAAKASSLRVHIIGHSHIDMNWLWTWPDTVAVIKRDFKSVLALMDDYPELVFSHSQPATYEVIRQEEPALFARVLEHIQSGRWEATTLAWLEGDVNMASGEAHTRQLLEGVAYSREVLNVEPSSYHAPDTFGHAGNLPQLAVSAGAKRYYHHRANPGQENQWPAYWWEGDDGTRLLAFSTYTYNGDILARDLANAAIRAHKFGHPAGLHFHGIGDHGGGPARQNLDALRRFQKLPGMPTAFCSRLDAYTRDILDAGGALPTWKGESSTLFEGCYTTHADTKRYNREGENRLCTADTLAALANRNHHAELQEAWRAVLFNQFHDILDGSAIHESYEKNAEDFAAVVQTADAVTNAALAVLEQGIAPGHIAVTNPLGWEREDWVTVPGKRGEGAVWLVSEDGHRTPGQYTPEGLGFVARVPAFATVGYRIETAPSEPLPASLEAVPAFAPTDSRQSNFLSEVAADAPYYRIETPVFRIYLRRDSGILVSFLDKRVNRQLVGYGMRRGSDYLDTARADLALNVLQLVEEYPHGMTAWHYDEVHTDFSLLRGATTRVVESGPARLVLEVQHSLRSSKITQRIHFYRDLARVDFQTDVDWQEIGNAEVGIPNLKAAFTARMPQCEAWYETPFAAVQRPSDGQEVPALRWADVGGPDYGFALLNDSKYGYDALGCRLRLTLLRSAYDPDAISDVGQHAIRYSFVPHPGDWRGARIVRQGQGFNQPLLAREVSSSAPTGSTSHRGFLPQVVGDSSVTIACLKMAYNGSGRVVRLYESAGRTVEARLEGLPDEARVWETNIVEDNLRELPVHNGGVTLAFRPWQVRTLLVESSE
ncbi:MAG TPA: glycoside hydrolase family 38 C-terminal domain-containing protein [Chthonomonadaceae bacterium]|nr:glycoside hydrolase family 38 C-terminal domain-containing protein [Chthonomonadaceae bacterium]